MVERVDDDDPLVVFLTAMADVEWVVSPSVADAGIPFDVQLRLQGEGRTGPDLDMPTPEVDGLVVLEGLMFAQVQTSAL